MFKRVVVVLTALASLGLVVLVAIRFLPMLATAFLWLLLATVCVAVTFFTVVSIAVAARIRPLRPVAEVSILGKHTVGLSKLVLGLLAFFGNTALTWFIALSVAFQKTPDIGFTTIINQLGGLFLLIATLIAYVYWMWIAVDLLRAGKVRRLQAVEEIEKAWLSGWGAPGAQRLINRASVLSMSSPWFLFLYTFLVSPLVILVGARWVFVTTALGQ